MSRRSKCAFASISGSEHGLSVIILLPAASALEQPPAAHRRRRGPASGPGSSPDALWRPFLPGLGEPLGAGAGFLPPWVAALGQGSNGTLRSAGQIGRAHV